MLMLFAHAFYAQDQKDLERLQKPEPLRSFYDSIISHGTFLSVSLLNRENPNDVYIGAPVNREFSHERGDSVLVNGLTCPGTGHDRFLRLAGMMKASGCVSLGTTVSPGNAAYGVQIVYAYSGATGRQQAYKYVYGQKATERALANKQYIQVKPGIFKYSFKSH